MKKTVLSSILFLTAMNLHPMLQRVVPSGALRAAVLGTQVRNFSNFLFRQNPNSTKTLETKREKPFADLPNVKVDDIPDYLWDAVLTPTPRDAALTRTPQTALEKARIAAKTKLFEKIGNEMNQLGLEVLNDFEQLDSEENIFGLNPKNIPH